MPESQNRLPLTVSAQFTEPVIVQASDAPLFRDSWPDGVEMVCGDCGGVLASTVAPDQFWNLSFQCFRCGATNDTAKLPPGAALPPSYIYLPVIDRPYRLGKTVQLSGGAIVGQSAKEQRDRELSMRVGSFDTGRPSRQLDREFLKASLDELREILGDVFDKAERSAKLAAASHTPAKDRNDLGRMILSVRGTIASFDGPRPEIEPAGILELDVLLHMLRRWRNHPMWPSIRAGIANEFTHTIVTLSVASLYEDHGNGVVLQEVRSRRTADLRIVLGVRFGLNLEVKCRQELERRSTPLTVEEAETIVAAAVDSAGDQLRDGDSLLILGSLHRSAAEIDTLERGAAKYLERHARENRKTYLVGIGLAHLSVHATYTGPLAQWQFSHQINYRLVPHPGYTGSVRIVDSGSPVVAKEPGDTLSNPPQ